MNFKDPENQDVQAAIEQEKTAIEDVKNAYKAKKNWRETKKEIVERKRRRKSYRKSQFKGCNFQEEGRHTNSVGLTGVRSRAKGKK